MKPSIALWWAERALREDKDPIEITITPPPTIRIERQLVDKNGEPVDSRLPVQRQEHLRASVLPEESS